ncbi:MAG TPA: CGNR zinc finger domain-containing protein [Gemmatimonadales bacterium]|nr:CGNR zinc finger domain-containing protein [Gemmatimonadales bacterium]
MFIRPNRSRSIPADTLPFLYIGGNPALDLVNTVDWTSRGPEHDRLSDYDRLTRWAEGAGVISARAGGLLRSRAKVRPGEADAAYRLALRARALLARLFGAIARGDPNGDALNDFNGLLGQALQGMRIAPAGKARRGRRGLKLGWPNLGEGLDAVIWPVLWSAATLLVSDEAPRIRICGGPDCGWMYVDRSRNRLRRWCQMETCGTREKSRRRYERMRRGRR